MARYLSVEETAGILGTTDRTVRRMLNEGRLAGSQHLDKGKMTWRVHATKELLERLEKLRLQSDLVDSSGRVEVYGTAKASDNNFEAEAIVDAIESDEATSETSIEPDEDPVEEHNNADVRSETARRADDIWAELEKKYLVKLLAQERQIGALQHQLIERDEEIRLLSGKAEEASILLLTDQSKEREAAAEAERLRSKVELLEQEQRESQERARRAELEIKAAKERAELEKIAEIEAIKRVAAEAELMRQRLLDDEHKKELDTIRAEMERLKEPWWKKWFTPSNTVN